MAEYQNNTRKPVAIIESKRIFLCFTGLMFLFSCNRCLSVSEGWPELRKLSHSQIDQFLRVVEKADFEKTALQAKDIFFHKGVWVTQLPDGYEPKFAKYHIWQTQHTHKYDDHVFVISRICYNLIETKSPYRCLLLQVEKPERNIVALIQIDAVHNKAISPEKFSQRIAQDVNSLHEILQPIPVESSIRLHGWYGCIAHFPFQIELKQKVEKIESGGNFSGQPVVSSLTYRDFVRIWDILQSPEGPLPTSTTDWGATVEIDCRTRDGLTVRKTMYLSSVKEIRSILAPSSLDNNP